jgi:hypothetical protein
MEDPASGLHLHLDLGVRGADDHVAYRTMSTSSSPDSAFRDGLRQDSALNPCRDGLIENAHRFLPLAVMARAGSALGSYSARTRRVSCQEFQNGSTCRHLIRMSFLTDFTPATPRTTLTAWSMSAWDRTKPLS